MTGKSDDRATLTISAVMLHGSGGVGKGYSDHRAAGASEASRRYVRGAAPRTISRYITGVTTRDRMVELISPPMITQASGP